MIPLRAAIHESVAAGQPTPALVDWVWRIGVRHVTLRPWLLRTDYEGVIQDTLIAYLDVSQLPADYDKPNHAIAARLRLAFRHAAWREQVDSGRLHNWKMCGERTTKQGKPHATRRAKRSGKTWKGTQRNSKTGRWRARLWVDGRDTTVGWYDTEAEAGRAYLAAVGQQT